MIEIASGEARLARIGRDPLDRRDDQEDATKQRSGVPSLAHQNSPCGESGPILPGWGISGDYRHESGRDPAGYRILS